VRQSDGFLKELDGIERSVKGRFHTGMFKLLADAVDVHFTGERIT
jgi:hypothetical protein